MLPNSDRAQAKSRITRKWSDPPDDRVRAFHGGARLICDVRPLIEAPMGPRKNACYPAGHMMYDTKGARARLRDDVAAFVAGASR